MKLLCMIHHPAGLAGIPDLCHLLTALHRQTTLCVIAHQGRDDGQGCGADLVLHRVRFHEKGYIGRMVAIARQFQPDVILFGHFARWPKVLQEIRKALPTVRCVLDVNLSLAEEFSPARLKKIEHHAAGCRLLDLVLTPAVGEGGQGMPPLWQVPMGLDVSRFTPRPREETQVRCSRFVVLGSFKKTRKLEMLLQLVAELPEGLKNNMVLDLYGRGSARAGLWRQVVAHGLEKVVQIRDTLSPDGLARLLPTYDAGILWAPVDGYDTTPSRQIFQYLAAGLVPMAVATREQQRLVAAGWEPVLFEENAASFGEAISRLMGMGYDRDRLASQRQRLQELDWDTLAGQRILPALEQLHKTGTTKPQEPAVKSPGSKKYGDPSLPVLPDTLSRMLIWSPVLDLPAWSREPRSGLRIACLVGKRLYQALRHEARLLLLTPQNGETLLRHGQPDLLLVESCWSSCTGDWYMSQTSPGHEPLTSLVQLARQLGVPTAYWLTWDQGYLPLFQPMAKHFDRIFCADPRAVADLDRQGMPALLLEPAIQPRVFHPFRGMPGEQEFASGIVYDGLTDLFKYQELRSILKKVGPDPLAVIETSCMIGKKQIERLNEDSLVPAIKGWVHEDVLPEVLKHASAVISFSLTQTSRTRAVWLAMQAAACRLPLVHLGLLDEDDPRRHFVRHWPEEPQFLADLESLLSSTLDGDKAGHLAWRHVHGHHTMAHRLTAITQALKIPCDRPVLKATLVTGSMRQEFLDKCIRQYLRQTYPHKEYIVVFNGEAAAVAELQERYAHHPDIRIFAIPTDYHTATLINFGASHATGQYLFKVDDDDYYGDHYLEDFMLHIQATEADVLGKRFAFFHLEGKDGVYLRKNSYGNLRRYAMADFEKSGARITGCSFVCRVDLLRSIPYPDHVNLSADAELMYILKNLQAQARCVTVDNFNLVIERFADIEKHTWRSSREEITDQGKVICPHIADVMI